MRTKTKKLASNTIIFAIGTIGSKVISFLLVPLYTNILTTSEFGIADLISTITTILLPLFSLCLGESILYYGLRKDSKYDLDSLFKNGSIAILLGCLILTTLSPFFLFYETLSNYVAFLCAYAVLEIIRYYLRNYLKALEKNKLYSIDSIIYAFTFASINILFILVLRLGVVGYLLSFIITELISIVFLLVGSKGFKAFKNGRIDKKTIRLIISYSAPLILNSISWAIANSSDKFMLDYFLSSSSVGIYSAATKIPTIINSFVGIFCQAWTLSAYIEYGNDDFKFYSKTFEIYSFVLIFISSCVLFVERPFMYIYVGKDFHDAMIYVPLLLIGVVYQGYASYFGSIIQSGKKNGFMALSTIIAVGVNLVANYFLIKLWGIQGACLATCISFAIVAILRIVFSKKVVNFDMHLIKFLIMNALLILQAVSVIFDFYFVIVSTVVLIILLGMNLKIFKSLVDFVLNKIKRKNKQKNENISQESCEEKTAENEKDFQAASEEKIEENVNKL